MSVKFTDYSVECKEEIKNAGLAFLEEAGGEIESQAKRNTKVVTGKTKGSFQHRVNEDEMICAIGSDYENALWEEMGTGIYAVEGNGRKTPWIYEDEQGVKHFTRGKRPRRMLWNAFNSLRGAIERMAEEKFGGIR